MTVGGSCHQAEGAPLLCRTSYTYRSQSGADGPLLVRDITQWQGGTPAYDVWDFPYEQAVSNWNSARGLQDFSRSNRPNDTFNYFQANIDPSGRLNYPQVGVTYLCNDSYRLAVTSNRVISTYGSLTSI